MEDILTLTEKVYKYDQSRKRLDELKNGLPAFRASVEEECQRKINKTLHSVREFRQNRQFLAILSNLCNIYRGRLSYSNGILTVDGKIMPPAAFHAENCCEVVEKSMRNVKLSVKALLSGTDAERMMGAMGTCFSTFAYFERSAERLTKEQIETQMRAWEGEIAALEKNIAEIEKEEGEFGADFSKLREALQGAALENQDAASVYGAYRRQQNNCAHAVPLGFKTLSVSEELETFTEDVFHLPKSTLSRTPLYLSPSKGQSAVFFETDEKLHNDVGLFKYLFKTVAGAMFRFEAKNLQLAFAESDSVYLSGIKEVLSKSVSSDLMYRGFDTASDKNSTKALINAIEGEMRERKSNFLGILKPNGSFCENITEYNALNPENMKKYILFVLYGYPDCMVDNESREKLEKIICDGGAAGILVMIFGKNIPVNGHYGEQVGRLSVPEGAMADIQIGKDGFALYGDLPLDLESVCADFEQNAAMSLLKERLKKADLFDIHSILENDSAVPFYETISIPVGNSGGRTYFLKTSTEKPPYPFTLVTGSTGSGKSAFLHTLILSGAYKYSPDELQFYIVDFKNKDNSVEFSDYIYKKGVENMYIPHVKYVSLKSKPENALEVIRYIKNLMNERNKLMNGRDISEKFKTYNSSPDVLSGKKKKMPQIMVIIDEYENMLKGGDRDEGSEVDMDFIGLKISDEITSIIKRARIYGIGVIFSGQSTNRFKSDAMAQISNRIAFHNDLFIFSSMFGKWNDKMISAFPVSEYAGYAYCAENSEGELSFTRMAYAGSEGARRKLAKCIREKYSEYCTGEQVVVGAGGSAVPLGKTPFRTWEQNAVYRAEMKCIEDPDCNAANRDALILSFGKERALTLGISNASSLSVELEYSQDANSMSCFAFAAENKLYHIERNAAFAFLFQTADRKYQNKRIIYCDTESRESVGDTFTKVDHYERCFGAFLKKYPFLGDCVQHLNGEMNIARCFIKLQKELEGRSSSEPYFIILHGIEWLLRDEINKWLSKPEPARVKSSGDVSKAKGVSYGDQLNELKNSAIPPALLASLKEKFKNTLVDTENDVAIEEENAFQAKDLLKAFAELYMKGNRSEIFLLVCSDRYSDLSDVVLSLATDGNIKKRMREHAVYGSYHEMKSGVSESSTPNLCYVCPAAAQTRMFDYSAPDCAEFFEDLKNRLENANEQIS